LATQNPIQLKQRHLPIAWGTARSFYVQISSSIIQALKRKWWWWKTLPAVRLPIWTRWFSASDVTDFQQLIRKIPVADNVLILTGGETGLHLLARAEKGKQRVCQ
jgi:hypothetical protein